MLLGGGKRYIPPVDNCPEGDMSPTQFDGLCAGVSPYQGGVLASTGQTSTGSLALTGSISVTGSVVT